MRWQSRRFPKPTADNEVISSAPIVKPIRRELTVVTLNFVISRLESTPPATQPISAAGRGARQTSRFLLMAGGGPGLNITATRNSKFPRRDPTESGSWQCPRNYAVLAALSAVDVYRHQTVIPFPDRRQYIAFLLRISIYVFLVGDIKTAIKRQR